MSNYTKPTLTALETKTLNWLKTEGWYNYTAEPYFTDVDAADVAAGTGIEIKSLKGVLGSLSKKGLICIDEYEANFEPVQYFIAATEETFEYFGDIEMLRELGY